MCGEDYIMLLLCVDLLGGVVDDWLVYDDFVGGVCLVFVLLGVVDCLVM